MADRRPEPLGLAIYSAKADADFSSIHENTAAIWGFEQAERYADFLEDTIASLAAARFKGRPVASLDPAFRAYYVRWHKAKHGHYIIYKEREGGGIFVLRILHGRMNLPDHVE